MAPSSPLVVKMVGMERRQLSWQRGRREITIAGMSCRISAYLGASGLLAPPITKAVERPVAILKLCKQAVLEAMNHC